MKPLLIPLYAAALTLTACIEPGALSSAETKQAQQEIRLKNWQRLSCSELRQYHTANKGNRGLGGYLTPAGAVGRQYLSDIEEVMRRKGCKALE